jgi:hypothetical protein
LWLFSRLSIAIIAGNVQCCLSAFALAACANQFPNAHFPADSKLATSDSIDRSGSNYRGRDDLVTRGARMALSSPGIPPVEFVANLGGQFIFLVRDGVGKLLLQRPADAKVLSERFAQFHQPLD